MLEEMRGDDAPRRLRHRVRSPLTVIIAYADTLINETQAGGVPHERLVERLSRIRTAASRIAALMDELDEASDREVTG